MSTRQHLMKVVVIFLTVVSLAGCAGMFASSRKPVYPTSLTSEMKEVFNGAEQNYMSGNFADARRSYQAYVSTYGYNEYTDEARFKLGEISFLDRNFETALSYYKEAYQNLYNPEIAPKAQFKAALSLSQLRQSNEAYSTLEQMDHRDVTPVLGIRADSLAINIGRQLGKNRDELIKWYLFLLDDYAASAPRDYEGRIKEVLVSNSEAGREVADWVNDATVGKAAVEALPFDVMKGKPSGGFVLYKTAMINYSLGDLDEAAVLMKKFLHGYPKHDFASNASALLAEMKGKIGGKKFKLGVILPLSGRFALYGSSTLHGIQCAAGLTPPCSSPLNVELIVKDSAGDPAVASRAVEELAKEGVVGIVGPLLSATVESAAGAAEKVGIPIVSLSQMSGVASKGGYVFKHALTPRDQVDTLVDYTVNKKGVKSFGILYPANKYGSIMAEMFKRTVEAQGEKVVFERSYEHTDLRASKSVKEMGSYTTLGGAVVEGMGKKFSVPNNVQALFIPDSYKAVRYVVLAIHNDSETLSPNLLYMGINRWNNPGLVSHDLGLLEGAVFVDGFYKDSADITTRNFVQSFLNAFGMEPTILEAQAYDAARIVMTGVRDGGTSRDKLKNMIGSIKNMAGVTGNITIGPGGESQRRLFILTVKNGMIAELSSARGIMHAGEPFPYSKASQMGSQSKYEGKRVPDLTVRTDMEKYEPLDFYTNELE